MQIKDNLLFRAEHLSDIAQINSTNITSCSNAENRQDVDIWPINNNLVKWHLNMQNPGRFKFWNLSLKHWGSTTSVSENGEQEHSNPGALPAWYWQFSKIIGNIFPLIKTLLRCHTIQIVVQEVGRSHKRHSWKVAVALSRLIKI